MEKDLGRNNSSHETKDRFFQRVLVAKVGDSCRTPSNWLGLPKICVNNRRRDMNRLTL